MLSGTKRGIFTTITLTSSPQSLLPHLQGFFLLVTKTLDETAQERAVHIESLTNTGLSPSDQSQLTRCMQTNSELTTQVMGAQSKSKLEGRESVSGCPLCWDFSFHCRVSLIPCVCNACSVFPPPFVHLFFSCTSPFSNSIPLVFSDYRAGGTRAPIQMRLEAAKSRKQ